MLPRYSGISTVRHIPLVTRSTVPDQLLGESHGIACTVGHGLDAV